MCNYAVTSHIESAEQNWHIPGQSQQVQISTIAGWGDGGRRHIEHESYFLLFRLTSRHQSARGDIRKQKSLQIVMFNSQESRQDRSQGLKKKKNEHSKNRPGRSATQWHCGLRLFFKHIYSTCITVPYCTWCVVLRPLFIFLFDKRSQTTLFEVDYWNDLISLPFEKRVHIPCLVWSRVLWCVCCMRVSIRFFVSVL